MIYPRRPANRYIILAFLAVGIIATVGELLLRPRFATPPAPDMMQRTANLRQIGQAIQTYAQNHQGIFPDNFDELIATQHLPKNLFDRPYIYQGKNLTTQTATPKIIIACEEPDSNAGINILLGNGQVDFAPKDQAILILNQIKAGASPVTLARDKK